MIRGIFKLGLFATALGLGALVAVAVFQETVEGSGNPATEDRAVGAVSEVSLSGIGNLVIIQGDVPSLSVTADDNLLPILETETNGNKLSIRTKSGYSIRPKGQINYTLTVPRLEKISVSGSGNVKCEKLTGSNLEIRLSGSGSTTVRELNCKSLTVGISGSGNATTGGTAEKVTARISGSGGIDAAALKSSSADVQVSGSGTVSVWATSELKAKVSGSGDVTYVGNPKVDKKVSGSGKVRPQS